MIENMKQTSAITALLLMGVFLLGCTSSPSTPSTTSGYNNGPAVINPAPASGGLDLNKPGCSYLTTSEVSTACSGATITSEESGSRCSYKQQLAVEGSEPISLEILSLNFETTTSVTDANSIASAKNIILATLPNALVLGERELGDYSLRLSAVGSNIMMVYKGSTLVKLSAADAEALGIQGAKSCSSNALKQLATKVIG